MAYKEKEVEKLYYSIGETAAMFDVATSLIRFWEQEFDILKPKKNKKGDRFFTQTDIANLKLIYYLVKERGYTLEGAKKKLKNKDHESSKLEIVESLKKLRSFLQELKNNLD